MAFEQAWREVVVRHARPGGPGTVEEQPVLLIAIVVGERQEGPGLSLAHLDHEGGDEIRQSGMIGTVAAETFRYLAARVGVQDEQHGPTLDSVGLDGYMDDVDRERLLEGLAWLRRDGMLALSLVDGVAEAFAASRTGSDPDARMLAIDHADQLAGLLVDMPGSARELRDLLERLIANLTLHACPCCGNYTLPDPPPGSDDICPVCWWQDDYVGFHRPERAVGPNRVSLDEGRRQFRARGYADPRGSGNVREPAPHERPEHQRRE